MSAAGIAVLDARAAAPVSRETARAAAAPRVWLRLTSFGALALYGVLRWATLLDPVPTWRLAGLAAVAVALAGAGHLLRGISGLQGIGGPAVAVLALIAAIGALAIAGVPLTWIVHERVAVTARGIGRGLSVLPTVLVPYLGAGRWVRTVIMLGAGVLLLDGAIVLAFAPRALGDLRRATVALPLTALAVVPSTLVRPQLPYLQGLVLFALLAAFMWGERVPRPAAAGAAGLVAVAGVIAAIAAPALDQHRPWIDYRAWAGSPVAVRLDAFDWNQSYGPLNWPHVGHRVLEVHAARGDYWKAEDLDLFNGTAWVASPQPSPQTAELALPAPDPRPLAMWTQQLRVTIEGMTTSDVIAAGYAAKPQSPSGSSLRGGALPGQSAGTWVAGRTLGPGTTYVVRTYSPHATAAALNDDVGHYPDRLLVAYRTIELPTTGPPTGLPPELEFAPFHSGGPVKSEVSAVIPTRAVPITSSPYAGAYALAQRLAKRAATPYQFVASVQSYLSRGFRYDQNPPLRRYPLESFLFKDKIGYCQQFSGAMALLLRMGGLPARVAAGFTSGTYDQANHEFVVSDLDAHAWVEVWFPKYGWVRFDPTPRAAPARGGTGILPILKTLPKAGSANGHGLGRPGAPAPTIAGTVHAASASGFSSLWVILAAALLAAGSGFGVMAMRAPKTTEQLVTELERALARSGRPAAAGLTLAALERRFRSSPPAAQYVRAIRLARFGGDTDLPTAAQRRALRAQLRFGLGTIGRLRALWALPPRPAARATGRSVADQKSGRAD
jgi:transglutaminase-like putative cysteine protease